MPFVLFPLQYWNAWYVDLMQCFSRNNAVSAVVVRKEPCTTAIERYMPSDIWEEEGRGGRERGEGREEEVEGEVKTNLLEVTKL